MTSTVPTPRRRRHLRHLLVVAAVLVFLAGLSLFVFPTHTTSAFAWKIASPMTAVFLGAAYWSSAVLEVAGSRARGWSRARIAGPTVLVFTVLTLVVTMANLPEFHLYGGHKHALITYVISWAWLAIYVIVPVLMAILLVSRWRGAQPDPPRVQRLPAWVHIALTVLAILLGGVGTALLLAPSLASGLWPWPLAPLGARAIGAWLVALAVAAVHARIEDDVSRIQPLAASAAAFSLLEGVALARFGNEVDWISPATVGYLAVLVILLALGAWTLRAGRRLPRPEAADQPSIPSPADDTAAAADDTAAATDDAAAAADDTAAAR